MSGLPLTGAQFLFLRNYVCRVSGILLDEGGADVAQLKLAAAAEAAGCASVGELLDRVRLEPNGEFGRVVVEALTVHETTFFRDARPFRVLAETVLPRLAAARASRRSLTIWCAACASGQEPYSVAMLLRDRFPGVLDWNLKIVASDLSERILARAREGRYSHLEVNRGLPAGHLVRFFRREGPDWRLVDDVRRMVEFRRLNLLDDWRIAGPVDVILVRNALIYMDFPARRSILSRMRAILAPDGFLFLGEAETTTNLCEGFERLENERVSCYRPASGPVGPGEAR